LIVGMKPSLSFSYFALGRMVCSAPDFLKETGNAQRPSGNRKRLRKAPYTPMAMFKLLSHVEQCLGWAPTTCSRDGRAYIPGLPVGQWVASASSRLSFPQSATKEVKKTAISKAHLAALSDLPAPLHWWTTTIALSVRIDKRQDMQRLSFPLTLIAVTLGVLIMAQFVAGPLRPAAMNDSLTVALARPQPDSARPDGGIERLDRRSGLINYNEIERRLDGLMEDSGMVGLAVAVVENGEITFARGYGETARDTGEPVTVDTVFRWASLSKGVTATLVTLLGREGALDLQAPISRYSQSLRLPNDGQLEATVIDLLSHRLGIERYNLDNRLEADEDPEQLRMELAERPSVCPPGTCHRYQNIAFDAASEIVETVTGENFEAATRRRLFQPLAMNTASASLEGLRTSASWARSHRGTGEQVPVLAPYYRIPAAGGVNGSIRDLARWMQVQMGGAADTVSPSLLELTHSSVVRTEREDRRNRRYQDRLTNAHYALGWRVYEYAGHRVITHRGAVRGYRALIMFDPDLRSGVVALWNSGNGRGFGIPMDVFDQLYGLPDGHWIEAGSTAGARPAS
jgi:beta-lactamase class C